MMCLVKSFKVDRFVSLYLGFYISIVTSGSGASRGRKFPGAKNL